MKMYLLQTIRPDSDLGIASNWSQIRKNDNDVTNSNIAPSSGFYDIAVFFFSYWSKFHLNIITSSRVMAIFLCKGLTRNLEIVNNPIGILSNIWRLGQVKNAKFVTNVCNEMFLNARFTAFTVSTLLRENQQGFVKLPPVHSTSWKFTQNSIHIVRADWMFLNKFGSSDPSFTRSILTLAVCSVKSLQSKLQLFINKYNLQVS